ncbi:hypothetical protein [Flavobacterium sp.]|uniref:hypothetical protein n=1 Tax=Flavobacterium sp. TaxID=239 RepID=UPI0026106110|nr:hypothetical protein [Flavobacterium sp.]
MKLKFILAIAFVSTLFSCSSDDSNGNTPENDTTYLPLKTGNYWTYDVNGENVAERDSLYISKDTVINSKDYKRFETLNQPFGFFSNSLNKNGVRVSGNSVLLSGTAGLNLGDVFPIDLTLNDFVVFKENASNGEQLSSVSGIIEQDYQGYPLKLEYTMKSTSVESLPSFTSPNNDVYTDVKKVKTILNLKISSTVTIQGVPFPLVITIMNPQDVVVSYQYYAKNIGMVYANTTINYELQDLSSYGVTLPIPLTGSQLQEEFLDTYSID